MTKGNLWTLAVIAVLLALLLPAANIAYADSTHENTKTETVTVDYTSPITVSEDAFEYNTSVRLTNASGTTLTDGVDYEWYPSNGSLEYYNTSSTGEGTENQLTYDYYTHDQATLDVSSMLAVFGEWGGRLFMVAAIGALLGLVFKGSGGGGGSF